MARALGQDQRGLQACSLGEHDDALLMGAGSRHDDGRNPSIGLYLKAYALQPEQQYMIFFSSDGSMPIGSRSGR
jgi:hypothetical protein